MVPDEYIIEEIINAVCFKLYEHNYRLIDEKANERTIVGGYLVPYLKPRFPGWAVDPEYNREGADRDSKTDVEGNLLLPDIIIHKPGPDGPNLVAIEVKGYWNKEDRHEDEISLRKLQAKHGYQYLYHLELEKNNHRLIKVAFTDVGSNMRHKSKN